MDSWFLPVGFRFCGLHSGIRPDPLRKDLALFFSDFPASAAGVFTTNKVKAAPVHLCKKGFPPILSAGLSSARAMPMPVQERKAWTMPERWQVLLQRQTSAKIKRFLFAPPAS